MDPVFIDSDATSLCAIVRSLAEEWGTEHLQILLPRTWERSAGAGINRSILNFVTSDTVVLIVGSGEERFCRELKLSSSCLGT